MKPLDPIMHPTPCKTAALQTAYRLDAIGVDADVVLAAAWALTKVVVRKIGREATRDLLAKWATAVDEQFVQPLDAPGPDRLVDPMVSRGMTQASRALADYLYEHSKQ